MELTTYSTRLSKRSTFTEKLELNFKSAPHFKEERILGGQLYKIYHNPYFVPIIDNPERKARTFGNLYVYERPVAGGPTLPPHSLMCHAEPQSIEEGDSYSCFLHTDYHGLLPDVQIWAGGTLFSPMEHDRFPALLEDLLTLLTFVDVTDDPKRQACVKSGHAWRPKGCD